MTPETLERIVRIEYTNPDASMRFNKALTEFHGICRHALKDEAELVVLPAPLAAVVAYFLDQVLPSVLTKMKEEFDATRRS